MTWLSYVKTQSGMIDEEMLNEELLIRFLTKSCTQKELLEVEKWISTDQAKAGWLFEIERVWSIKDELHYSDREIIDAAFQRFTRACSFKLQKPPIKRLIPLSWLKYVALIVITGLLASNIYLASRIKPSEEETSNLIEVPVGQRVSITLADGTKVWLNSGSILSYPGKFDLKNRIVRLDGEGYFEVTAVKENPFVVKTSILEVEVLGTKFNVLAYPDDDMSVSLLEGQLHIQADKQSAFLEANEYATWSKKSGLVHYKNKAVHPTAQWITGELMFVNERLADIAKTLERRYGVTIIIENPKLLNETFVCRTHPEPTLEQVLILLKDTKKITYSIKGQTVYIK